jgi:hypothetical protein
MSEITVERFRDRWRVVMVHDNGTRTVLGTYNAKFKAEHEAEEHRRRLQADES